MQLNFDISFNIATQKQNNEKYNSEKNNAAQKNAVYDAAQTANSSVNNAVNDARQKGVNITKGDDINVSSVEEAQRLATQQIEELQAAGTSSQQRLANAAKGTITSGMVDQGLKLGKETNADVTFSDVTGDNNGGKPWDLTNNSYKLSKDSQYAFIGSDGQKYDWTFSSKKDGGEASKQWGFITSTNTSALHITATYTNLKNSSYTDARGVAHYIAKIVATYDAKSNGLGYPALWINTDPSEGFWYKGMTDVKVKYQLFDSNNTPIIFGNNAWVTFSSLNAGSGSFKQKETKNGRHERVQGAGNITLHQLDGSSVTLHDGLAYSVGPNDSTILKNDNGTIKYALAREDGIYEAIGNPTSGFYQTGDKLFDNSDQAYQNGYRFWDNSNGDYQYYGAILGQITPGTDSYTIDYSTDVYGDGLVLGTYNDTWAMPSTTIPTTPGISYTYHNYVAPKVDVPTPKTTEIHYHYDVS